MKNQIRIHRDILLQHTDADNERNIYIHPNFIARDIFWQRLEALFELLKQYTKHNHKILDFGGGSGVFSVALCRFFEQVDVIDRDTGCAENLQKLFGLENLNLINADIITYNFKEQYDIITAADVLEHFKDLAVPLEFLKKNLKAGGLLFISIPTENWLYELGRVIVRKTKPVDHYHTSEYINNFLCANGFKKIKSYFRPKYIFPIPLFNILIFEKL